MSPRRRLRRREPDPEPPALDADAPVQSRGQVLRGAARRFASLLGLAALVVLVISVPVGLLLGSSVGRSISVGFYVIGSFLLVAGFFVGNRGPVRLRGTDAEMPSAVGMFGIGIGGRRLRWATPEETADTMASSAVFVAIGFVLILVGVIADSRVELL